VPLIRGTQARLEPSASLTDRSALRDRVREVGRECPAIEPETLEAMLAIVADPARGVDAVRDGLSTRLMDSFRLHRGRSAFGLLYEINRQHLLQQVASRLRRYQSRSDPQDVLQEVFFNVYRYPHRFDASRDDAFRVWSATIVRNTVLKHLRSLSRSGRAEVAFEDLPEPADVGAGAGGPVRGVIDDESRLACTRVYLTYLHLYLRFYTMLSERERRAIHLVEVDCLSYRDAAAQLEIKLENLKMVIFRARRKIHRSMRRVFEGLPPDCRPARDPRARTRHGESAKPGAARGTKDGVK
jgi:RNA polymerase sigma factor (sigma-70 family)